MEVMRAGSLWVEGLKLLSSHPSAIILKIKETSADLSGCRQNNVLTSVEWLQFFADDTDVHHVHVCDEKTSPVPAVN